MFNNHQFLKITCFSLLLFSFACKERTGSNSSSSYFSITETGAVLKAGDPVILKVNFSDPLVDSVQYFIDDQQVKITTDTSQVQISTADYPLGSRLLTAKIFRKGVEEDATSNIVLISATKPAQYSYKIVKTYPHSTDVYTEGLEYHDGFLYESAGDYGHSALLKETLDGKVVQKQTLDDK